MNRECCYTNVTQQIIKHHLLDLAFGLHMLELCLMIIQLVAECFMSVILLFM